MAEITMTPFNQTMSTANDSVSADSWMNGYPIIYPITMFHLYPIVMFGRICHVLWYITGFTGNIISLKIWTLSRMKRLNSSALYLVGITLCDLAYQVLHIFLYLKFFWGLASLAVTGFCQAWNVLYIVPQYASQFLVLGFTTERFISIIRPFKGERFSRTQRAPKIVITMFVFALLATVPQALFWEVYDGFCEMKQGTQIVHFYTVWSFVTEILIFFFVPVVTLFLNIFLLREAHNALSQQEQRLNLQTEGSSRIHRKRRKCRPSTKTLLCISFFRILTQLPVSVTYTIQNLDEFAFGSTSMSLEEMSQNTTWRCFLTYWGARMVIETLGAAHHALSVFIFYASTQQFRNEISNMIRAMKSRILRRPDNKNQMDNINSELKYASSIYTRTTVKEMIPL